MADLDLPASVISLDRQDHLNLLSVEHDGSITWEELQTVKDQVWGERAVAMELFPASGKVVNSGNYRHLWRLGAGDFVPDLMSDSEVLDDSHGPGFETVYRMGDQHDRETLT